jgi:hypothetical protein
MASKTPPESSFLHRLFCAIFNTYPFKERTQTEAFYRNGDWEEFQKEWLNQFRNTEIKSESPFTNFASIATVISLIAGIIFYFLPYNNATNKLLTLPMLIVILGFISILSILVLLIWNDKKNYCHYYEQLIKKNHDVLEQKVADQLKLIDTYNYILSIHLHKLAEEFRILLHFFNSDSRDEQKGIDSLQRYINTLCEITSQYFIDYKEKLGMEFIDKYSCCIKLINLAQLYTKTTIDENNNKRLQDYASKYDSGDDKLAENTDFNTILREKRWYYYLSNFLEKVQKKQYRTTHPDGHEYYSSAVTFPIIYRWDDKKSVLLGFLCFDNLAPNAFPTCNEPDNNMSIKRIERWEGFCCSQLDFLSIAIAKYLRLDLTKEINKSLLIGPIKKAK